MTSYSLMINWFMYNGSAPLRRIPKAGSRRFTKLNALPSSASCTSRSFVPCANFNRQLFKGLTHVWRNSWGNSTRPQLIVTRKQTNSLAVLLRLVLNVSPSKFYSKVLSDFISWTAAACNYYIICFLNLLCCFGLLTVVLKALEWQKNMLNFICYKI